MITYIWAFPEVLQLERRNIFSSGWITEDKSVGHSNYLLVWGRTHWE